MIWPGEFGIVDLIALLFLLLISQYILINLLLVILTYRMLDEWHSFLFAFKVEVVFQVKPFCTIQHDLTSRSVFGTSNQIILWQSLFLKVVPEM